MLAAILLPHPSSATSPLIAALALPTLATSDNFNQTALMGFNYVPSEGWHPANSIR
jgi:hypothetical protein